MSVLNCWSLSLELSVYLFDFYLWIIVCPVLMPVFHYFSHLICMYTYLILIMWCNVMWAFFVLHFADICSCCHMYVLYIPAAFLLMSCMWLPFSLPSHPLSIFMSLLLLFLLLLYFCLMLFCSPFSFIYHCLSFIFGEGQGSALCCAVMCIIVSWCCKLCRY